MRLNEKVCLITGAAAGIGKAKAEEDFDRVLAVASFVTGAVLRVDGGMVIGT